MQLYARRPGRAAKQVGGDLLVALGAILAVRLGLRVREVVAGLGAPGREVAEAGSGLARAAQTTSGQLAEMPLVGGALRQPFELLADGGRALVEAGNAQQSAAEDLALLLAVLVTTLPLALLLAVWLPPRLRWVREATAAARIVGADGGDALLALRAVTTRPLAELLRVEPDPWGALRRGETSGLAELERSALGLPRRISAGDPLAEP